MTHVVRMRHRSTVAHVSRDRHNDSQQAANPAALAASSSRLVCAGRADLRASDCRIGPLDVVPNPILPHNPNYADVISYPPRKDEQLSLAAKLAASIEGVWHSVSSAGTVKPDQL